MDLQEPTKEEIQDRYLRLASEFENYKKRQEKEAIKTKKFVCKELLEDILPVIDGLETLKLMCLTDNFKVSELNHKEAINSITQLLNNMLKKYKVIPIENPAGKLFNPKFHKSLGFKFGTKETVVKQLRKGYMIENILLRPTDVLVGMI